MQNGDVEMVELMAPAGDWECARAAVANGANAIYFGLQDGLNARKRATNFAVAELPELMAFLHVRGVKGYLTLNTLIFGDELSEAEQIVRAAVAAGVDALLVQDLGLTRLVGRLCPDLPLHASTQMTLSSAECIAEAASLGVRRVVLPREMSIADIAAIRRETDIELEAFVHGALCMSYSGQCLASLTFGGRSGNRGQCAQPCRLPYEVISDGRPLDLGDFRYPMSPQDLAAHDRLPELMAAGVSAFKIEGRLKPAEYVAVVTRHYRAALDAALASQRPSISAPRGAVAKPETGETVSGDLERAFSRGFCHGWLDGARPRELVLGMTSAKRGTLLGQVTAIHGGRVSVSLADSVRRGDGVVFDGDRADDTEVGGRVYEIFQDGRPAREAAAGQTVELAFRHGTVEAGGIRAGGRIWKTDDPQADRQLRKSIAADEPCRRVPIDMTIEASVGRVLRLTVRAATGAVCHLESPEPLAQAVKHPLTLELLTEQFDRLGNTPYKLRNIDAQLDGRAMVPLSVLGTIRREMIEKLQAAASQPLPRVVSSESPLAALRAECVRRHGDSATRGNDGRPRLHVLCRSMSQLEAALRCGVSSLIADFRQTPLYPDAIEAARAAHADIQLATPRIDRPHNVLPTRSLAGEGPAGVFQALAKLRPDGLLVRNLAGLAFCRRTRLPAVADFSLNAANDLTFRWLCEHGARRVTAAYDLSRQQLIDLALVVPPDRLEVIVYRHVPMFHAEYCLYCRTLSHGNDRTDCGRPCERRVLRLRDRRGVEHPVLPDSQCRNTVFHADASDLFDTASSLKGRGVVDFRIELTTEDSLDEVRGVIASTRRAIRQDV
ncbi:MAG: DUF3656 domain-containing protein [Thermoguttaceae bacterium]